MVNMVVNYGESIRKLVDLGSEKRDSGLVRLRAKEFTTCDAELSMIENYYRLVVNSTYFREEAYDFLVRGKSYRQIIEKHGIKDSNLRNVIYRETRRLFRELQHDPLGKVINGECTKELIEVIESRICELEEKETYRDYNSVTDLFTFDIESKSQLDREFNRNIEDDDFKDLVDVLKYFVRPYQDVLLDQLDERYLGYILYLLKMDEKSLLDVDKERKKYIMMGWMMK